MKVKRRVLEAVVLAGQLACASAISAETYEPTWESLSKAPLPEWAEDAKFGIYAHWGIYSVGIGPAWLERHIYREYNEKAIEKLEALVGGTLAEGYGYKDLLQFLTAKEYDPAAWADLMVKSGAKFAGFSIGHHDGFGLWDSDVYEWNAGKMGPKRDLYGEFVRELRKRELKVFCTSHMFRHYTWSVPQGNTDKDKEILARGMKEKWDIFDPKYNHIYQNQYNGSDYQQYRKDWQAKITEVIDKYMPDVIWFDGDILGGVDFLDPLAHYFNKAEREGREVVVCNKYPMSEPEFGTHYNFPASFGWVNFEQGRSRPVKLDFPWSEDFTITGKAWSYTGYDGAISGKQLIRRLIDCTARGGCIMVSLCPRADGSIPQAQQQCLIEAGEWLEDNGEAIFATRKWIHESDETEEETMQYVHTYRDDKHHKRWHYDEMAEGVFRYTRSKDGKTIYAITLGMPQGVRVTAKHLTSDNASIKRVSLLGCHEDVTWKQTAAGLVIELPSQLPNDKALAFKVEVQ